MKLFLQFVKESDRKPNTLRHYEGRIKDVRKRLGDRPIEKLTLEEVEDAISKANQWPNGTMKAPDTRRGTVIVVQQVFKFAVRRAYLAEPLFDKLERPPPSRSGIPRLSRLGGITTPISRDWRSIRTWCDTIRRRRCFVAV